MQELDSKGVSTMVFEMDATRWHNEIENATTLCALAMKRTKHFLVFGSFSFVAQQFQQVNSVSSSFFFALKERIVPSFLKKILLFSFFLSFLLLFVAKSVRSV